jgi:hypothetical protein
VSGNNTKSQKNVGTTLNQLKTLLGTHANLLETIDQNESEKFRTNCNNPARKENKTFIASTESSSPVCNEHHAIYSCTTFLNLNINNRIKKIKELKLCLNCLKGGHYTATCKSGYCKQGKGKHNSLLHLQKKEVGTTVDNSASTNSTTFASYSSITAMCCYQQPLLTSRTVREIIKKPLLY